MFGKAKTKTNMFKRMNHKYFTKAGNTHHEKPDRHVHDMISDSTQDSYLLRMPEEVIREIFTYLTEDDIYFRLRHVCRQLRKYAEDYVTVDALFEEGPLYRFNFTYIRNATNSFMNTKISEDTFLEGYPATLAITQNQEKKIIIKEVKSSCRNQDKDLWDKMSKVEINNLIRNIADKMVIRRMNVDNHHLLSQALGESQVVPTVNFVEFVFRNAVSSPIDILSIDYRGKEMLLKGALRTGRQWVVNADLTTRIIFRKSNSSTRCVAYANGKRGLIFEGRAFGAGGVLTFAITIKTERYELPAFRHPNVLCQYGYAFEVSEPSSHLPISIAHHILSSYAIYPFMQNGSLYKYLRKCKVNSIEMLTPKQRLNVALGIAKGIDHIHELGYLHCNISSENILFDNKMQPKIGGLTEIITMHPDASYDTDYAIQFYVGSLPYMPPEAVHGLYSKKSDVFSFGIVLLELVTGIPAMDGNRSGNDFLDYLNEIVSRWATKSYSSISDVWGNGMEDSDWRLYYYVKSRCLERDRINRATIKEIITNLERIIGGS